MHWWMCNHIFFMHKMNVICTPLNERKQNKKFVDFLQRSKLNPSRVRKSALCWYHIVKFDQRLVLLCMHTVHVGIESYIHAQEKFMHLIVCTC